MFHLDQFISQYVTKRPVSMFSADIEANRDALTQKIAGKSVLVIGGSALAVSNFTLAADISHGNRPSFTGAAKPELATPLYEHFCEALRAAGVPVETGVFGADMQIDTVCDGPVTILADSDLWKA